MRRPIIAVLIRRGKQVCPRRYARLDNAIPRYTQLLMQYGQPRDVVEFSHADTGLQIGTIKVHECGRMTTDWIWGR